MVREVLKMITKMQIALINLSEVVLSFQKNFVSVTIPIFKYMTQGKYLPSVFLLIFHS